MSALVYINLEDCIHANGEEWIIQNFVVLPAILN